MIKVRLRGKGLQNAISAQQNFDNVMSSFLNCLPFLRTVTPYKGGMKTLWYPWRLAYTVWPLIIGPNEGGDSVASDSDTPPATSLSSNLKQCIFV